MGRGGDGPTEAKGQAGQQELCGGVGANHGQQPGSMAVIFRDSRAVRDEELAPS